MLKLIGLSVAALGLTACDQMAQQQMDDIYGKVAKDAVIQYSIASQSGGMMDRCVQAGFVVAAYLQAQEQEKYADWKTVEERDCAAAGLPKT